MCPFCLLCLAVLVGNHEVPGSAIGEQASYSKQCYGELGCFSLGGDFSERLVNLFPLSREQVNTRFLLFTKGNTNQHDFIKAGDINSVRNSLFSPSRPTKMIVHGFLEDGFVSWVKDMMRQFLIKGDFNVISVDWGGGSSLPYTRATANTRLVGAEIALLIKFLQKETGAKAKDFHIIGHSLGSHIAGYAGERLQGLGRITGMDPADPYFQDMPPSVRLDPTDALFVDVLHTDAAHIVNLVVLNGGMGLEQPVGHVDFYPNGGKTQPGCDQGIIQRITGQGIYNGGRDYVACNHLRAIDFFTESINSRCPYRAYQCSSYEDFQRGACISCAGSRCGFMGFTADQNKPRDGRTNVKYYLQTGGESPFCRYHYKVTVKLGNPAGARSQKGTIKIQLYGSRATSDELFMSEDDIQMEPGDSYTKLVTQARDLGDLQKVAVSWGCDSDILLPWNWCFVRTTKLYLSEVQVVSGDKNQSFQFTANNAELEPDVKKIFMSSRSKG